MFVKLVTELFKDRIRPHIDYLMMQFASAFTATIMGRNRVARVFHDNSTVTF